MPQRIYCDDYDLMQHSQKMKFNKKDLCDSETKKGCYVVTTRDEICRSRRIIIAWWLKSIQENKWKYNDD